MDHRRRELNASPKMPTNSSAASTRPRTAGSVPEGRKDWTIQIFGLRSVRPNEDVPVEAAHGQPVEVQIESFAIIVHDTAADLKVTDILTLAFGSESTMGVRRFFGHGCLIGYGVSFSILRAAGKGRKTP
jgi:hypothetical protein